MLHGMAPPTKIFFISDFLKVGATRRTEAPLGPVFGYSLLSARLCPKPASSQLSACIQDDVLGPACLSEKH